MLELYIILAKGLSSTAEAYLCFLNEDGHEDEDLVQEYTQCVENAYRYIRLAVDRGYTDD